MSRAVRKPIVTPACSVQVTAGRGRWKAWMMWWHNELKYPLHWARASLNYGRFPRKPLLAGKKIKPILEMLLIHPVDLRTSWQWPVSPISDHIWYHLRPAHPLVDASLLPLLHTFQFPPSIPPFATEQVPSLLPDPFCASIWRLRLSVSWLFFVCRCGPDKHYSTYAENEIHDPPVINLCLFGCDLVVNSASTRYLTAALPSCAFFGNRPFPPGGYPWVMTRLQMARRSTQRVYTKDEKRNT